MEKLHNQLKYHNWIRKTFIKNLFPDFISFFYPFIVPTIFDKNDEIFVHEVVYFDVSNCNFGRNFLMSFERYCCPELKTPT